MSDYTADTKFIDLGAQQALIRSDIDLAITRVLDHGHYIMGPEVGQLESALSQFSGAKNVISCANGTDALTLALMAWNTVPGDAVFVPSFTYVASAEAPALLGAVPFFVDIDPLTFNICADSLVRAIEDSESMGLVPRAVIAVDLFGQPADAEVLQKICAQHGLKLLIDAAQSFGASSRGRQVGTFGDATTTSFFPAKPLGCYGDGGAVFTSDDELAETVRSIRLHGKGAEKYDNVRLGMNSRLDTIQAAILLEKLKLFPNELKLRQAVAERYNNRLASYVNVPTVPDDSSSAWAQYTITVSNRDRVVEALKSLSIPYGIYYPRALHHQQAYSKYPSVTSGLSNSEKAAASVLSLPMHPYLTAEEQNAVCRALIDSLQDE